jgi:hypothetical protein
MHETLLVLSPSFILIIEKDDIDPLTANIKDQDAIKKETMEKAKKVAINHFAGKEDHLKLRWKRYRNTNRSTAA